MDINIGDYVTFRNVVLVIFCLPLVTMLVSSPFIWAISKGIREAINMVGYLGAVANAVVSVELAFRTIAAILEYKYQKPQIVFDIKSGMTSRYEPFDSAPIIYLIVFLVITIATFVVADIYSLKMKCGPLAKPNSEQNPLNLFE